MPKFPSSLSSSSSSLLKSLLKCKPKSFSTSSSTSDLSSAIEKLYRALKTHHQNPKILTSTLNSLETPISPLLISRLLSRIGPSIPLALSLLSHPQIPISPSLHPAILNLLSRSRNFNQSWSLIDFLRTQSPHLVTQDLFVVMMRKFAKRRMVENAVKVLDEMSGYGCAPDEYVFGCLVDALAKNGGVKEAAKVVEEMREKFPTKLRYFTSLLYGWCKAGKMEESKFVLVQMKKAGFEPDVVVYNTLISGFCSVGKIEDGHELLNEMRKKGCEPNVITYTSLIQALCVRERMDEAMKVFVEMRRHECLPDAITYTTLISGFAKCGKIERAFEFLDRMVKNGCRLNPTAYFPIFIALEKKEDLEQCLELMRRMSRDRSFPDLGIYNTVIRLSCKLGQLDQAVELWNEMEASGLSPGLDSFVIVVHGFLGQGSLIEACKYFREMVGRGLLSVPQYGIMKDLLNSLLRDEKLELAKEIWGLIVSKGGELNVYAWTIWIHALFAKKHVKEACLYCLDMMKCELMPQPDTFARLMKGLKKLYNRAIAAEITERVRAMAKERNVSFKMYKRRGVIDLEKKNMKKMERRKEKGKRGRPGGRGHSRRGNAFSLDSEDL